jgi:hypothetical protein
MSTTSAMMKKKGKEGFIPIAGPPILEATKIVKIWPQQLVYPDYRVDAKHSYQTVYSWASRPVDEVSTLLLFPTILLCS